MDLLAAEMTARMGRDPGELYMDLADELGASHYQRIDIPATPGERAALEQLSPLAIKAEQLAGETVLAIQATAPGNGAPIGGIKLITASGWFAVRPSGTENICKLYAESLKSQSHLDMILQEAQAVLRIALAREPLRS